jgi:hypothetical protein
LKRVEKRAHTIEIMGAAIPSLSQKQDAKEKGNTMAGLNGSEGYNGGLRLKNGAQEETCK